MTATATSPASVEVANRTAMVAVWDPLIRVFHWSLAATFAFAWATADEWDKPHEWAGYIILGLLGVRLLWGFIGSRHARFSDFVQRPAVILAYLKDAAGLRAQRYLGHNPAGGAMILALILALAITATSGYLTTIDALWGAEWVEDLHEGAANLTLGLVFLHVLGVVVSSLEHRENLVRSMITGSKRAS